jgi:hypothetical protein
MMITVIGRGHSGTRAMSHTLSASGVYMGAQLNGSGDLIPPENMYEACRVMARHVVHLGKNRWDFSRLHSMPIDPAFQRLIESFLASVLSSDAPRKGWKIPETTLVYPWIARMFPDIHYIYWVRDPRDCILGQHVTDDLSAFGIPYDKTDDVRLRRAISWEYQVEIVKATPRPRNVLTVRFEDFVLDQNRTLKRLEQYLGFPLARIPVRPETVGRWKQDDGVHFFDFFLPDLIEHRYELPARAGATKPQ